MTRTRLIDLCKLTIAVYFSNAYDACQAMLIKTLQINYLRYCLSAVELLQLELRVAFSREPR